VLDRVVALGLAGCQFASPFELSPNLDLGEVRAVHSHALALGLYVDVAIGQIHPHHFDARPEVLALGDGDMRAGLQRLIEAIRTVDCTEIMFTIGSIADRFNPSMAWQEQVGATTAFLCLLGPVLRDLDCRLCVKTHEEITSFEVARMVDALGADLLSVCFDPVNVLVRLEDPLVAAQRLLPSIRQVQVDDALLTMNMRGLERWLMPYGGGIVDWPAIVTLLPPETRRTIELHRAFFDMPVFDPAWLAGQPDLTVSELASVFSLASRSANRPLVKAFQEDPVLRLEPTLAHLTRAA
jgi:sugar phosphate isomerase/epimerase